MPPKKQDDNPYATAYSVPDANDAVHYDDKAARDGSEMAKPSCTDVPCCLIFILFLVAMVQVASYGFANGDPRKLTHGYDYTGQVCGVDANVTGKPLLFWCPGSRLGNVVTSLSLEYPICVASCPEDETTLLPCPLPETSEVTISGTPPYTQRTTVLEQKVQETAAYPSTTMGGMYCVPRPDYSEALLESLFASDGPLGGPTSHALEALGGLSRCWKLLFGAALFAVVLGYLYLLLLKLCARNLVFTMVAFITIGFLVIGSFFLFGDVLEMTGCCVAESISTASNATTAAASAASTTAAATAATAETTAAATTTAAAATTTTAAATTTPTAATAATTAVIRRLTSNSTSEGNSTEETFDLETYGVTGPLASWREANPLYHEYDEETAQWLSRCFGGLFVLIGLLCGCLFMCFLSSLDVALRVIEAACECLFKMPMLLVQPLIEVTVKMIFALGLLYGFLFLASTGEMQAESLSVSGNSVSGVHRSFTYTDDEKYYMAFYIFGFLWIMEFLNALTQFIIAYMVVSWYFSDKSHIAPVFASCQGTFVGIFFHGGTLALGSFLIATLRFLRGIMTLISKQSEESGNRVGACLAKCCICCLDCFERFMKFVNKNAYIDVVISSNSFCAAAKNVMSFIASAAGEIFILNGACFIFSVVGVLGIALATGLFTYFLVVENPRWSSDSSLHHVSDPEFVAAVAGTIGGLVATVFMMVFDHTADTLLYTFEWNRQHAHNSVDKYAPASLKKLVNYSKKSKDSKSGSGGGFFSFLWGGGGKSEGTSEEKTGLLETKK